MVADTESNAVSYLSFNHMFDLFLKSKIICLKCIGEGEKRIRNKKSTGQITEGS